MHGLIFETSICYWQDQPVSYPSRRGLAYARHAPPVRTYVRHLSTARGSPPLHVQLFVCHVFEERRDANDNARTLCTRRRRHATIGAKHRPYHPLIASSAAGIPVQHTHCSVHLTGSTAFARSENAATSHLCSRQRSTIAISPSSSLQPPSTYLHTDGASMPKAYRASYEKKNGNKKDKRNAASVSSMHDASHLSGGMLWEGQEKIYEKGQILERGLNLSGS